MYQKIMIPVDGSVLAIKALEEGLAIAKQMGSEVLIVHVLEPALYVTFDASTDIEKEIVRSAQDVLDKALEHAHKLQMDPRAYIARANNNNVANVIVDEAKKWRVDLLVIGTHGRGGVSRYILGSVADRVVRISTIPVLLVMSQEK